MKTGNRFFAAFTAFAALAAFALCAGCILPATAQAAALDKLKAFVEGTHSGKADFIQMVASKSGHKPQNAAGQMLFSRPGKFRWTYDKPYYQLIVGDGERLWVYDRDLNQVSVKKLAAALGSSPAALLAGDNALEKNFDLKEGGASNGIEWVDARPKNQESGFQYLRIGFVGNMLRAMEITDSFGQVTTIAFENFERNPALPAAQFQFTPPKGADVLGE
ncbi:MAG: outer membrane lipoprotein chaperone LolA [Zoogloeaceae bacterium]|jgi:outer membrane lipoprotein carrier protein|nr:outer membrane lipoprotein chaperone LolA [Zoogloeaceae bacterium]